MLTLCRNMGYGCGSDSGTTNIQDLFPPARVQTAAVTSMSRLDRRGNGSWVLGRRWVDRKGKGSMFGEHGGCYAIEPILHDFHAYREPYYPTDTACGLHWLVTPEYFKRRS